MLRERSSHQAKKTSRKGGLGPDCKTVSTKLTSVVFRGIKIKYVQNTYCKLHQIQSLQFFQTVITSHNSLKLSITIQLKKRQTLNMKDFLGW